MSVQKAVTYVIKLPEVTLYGYPDKMTKAEVVKQAIESLMSMTLTERDTKVITKESKVRKSK